MATSKGYAHIDSDGDVLNGSNVKVGVGENYAGIRTAENAVESTIDLTDLWHKVVIFSADTPAKISTPSNSNNRITIGATGDYQVTITFSGETASANKTMEFHVYSITAATKAITACTKASPGVLTAVAHGRSNGNEVCIINVAGMTELNGKIYKIANKADDTFELQDSESVNVDTSGFTTYTSGGTIQLATPVEAHTHHRFPSGGAGTFQNLGGHTFETLTLNNFIELYLKNVTDNTNFTFDDLNMTIKRIG